MSLYKTIQGSFENVVIDNMKHMKQIYQAFLINDRFHLIKWKQGYYDGAFEVMDKKYKNKDVFYPQTYNWSLTKSRNGSKTMSNEMKQYDVFGNVIDYEKNETMDYLRRQIKNHEKKIVKAQEKILKEQEEIKRLMLAMEIMHREGKNEK